MSMGWVCVFMVGLGMHEVSPPLSDVEMVEWLGCPTLCHTLTELALMDIATSAAVHGLYCPSKSSTIFHPLIRLYR